MMTVYITPEWTPAGHLLETTIQQCLCGARHQGVSFYDVYVARTICRGAPTTSRKMVPHDATRPLLPHHQVERVVRHRSTPICPSCVDQHSVVALPTITEAEWEATLRRKAAEVANATKVPTHLMTKAPKRTFSLDDFMKEIAP